MPLLSYQSTFPTLAPDCFVAPGAMIIGDVEIGEASSIWFGTIIRGDVFHIRIGRRTNIQDGSVLHVTTGRHPTIVGDDVTVGHRVVLHGCTVGDGALIGMGAVVMDRATIGMGALVAAGSLVSEGTEIPPHTLAMGTPARPKRPLTDEERQHLVASSSHYVELASAYLLKLGKGHEALDRPRTA